uniref:Uncharacterized protein n=1 Tax=Alexandrium andersonii TaxID=327968 RepID=A0A7S2FLV3_9DINO
MASCAPFVPRLDLLPPVSQIFSGCPADEVLDCLQGVAHEQTERRLFSKACPAPMTLTLDVLPTVKEIFVGCSADEIIECLDGMPQGRAAGLFQSLRPWPLTPTLKSLPAVCEVFGDWEQEWSSTEASDVGVDGAFYPLFDHQCTVSEVVIV